MNKVILTGNLTRDPELHETAAGKSVLKFDIAVNRGFKDADGNYITDFFNVSVWGDKGVNCGRYLFKGSKVGVVGRLQNRTYKDKEGNNRIVTEVVAEDVEFLTPKRKDVEPEEVTRVKKMRPELEPIDDDLPF
nr:MAG TPA: Single strand binding protein [Caudoviricetes sp.]